VRFRFYIFIAHSVSTTDDEMSHRGVCVSNDLRHVESVVKSAPEAAIKCAKFIINRAETKEKIASIVLSSCVMGLMGTCVKKLHLDVTLR
jgi:hypothetical protein